MSDAELPIAKLLYFIFYFDEKLRAWSKSLNFIKCAVTFF